MGEIKRYRKKTVEVEAVQWTGENREEVEAFAPVVSFTEDGRINKYGGPFMRIGMFVIREKGRFIFCKPDIFEATYEPVGEE